MYHALQIEIFPIELLINVLSVAVFSLLCKRVSLLTVKKIATATQDGPGIDGFA
jgi:hypothetical protein